MKHLLKIILIIAFAASTQNNAYNQNNNESIQQNKQIHKENIVLLANKLVGEKYKTFRYKDKRFRGDCSGFVQFIFETQKRALLRPSIKVKKGDSLAHSLFLSFKKDPKASFHKDNIPKPADIVFFHNTYDQNRNGKVDEINTHVGIVTEVDDENNTVHFVHYLNKKEGIKKDKLNLKKRSSVKYNSFIRNRKKYPHPKKYYLTGELFAYFARIVW